MTISTMAHKNEIQPIYGEFSMQGIRDSRKRIKPLKNAKKDLVNKAKEQIYIEDGGL